MPTVWDNSHVDRIERLHGPKRRIDKAVPELREAIALLTGPDAAKILVAIAADVVTGIQKRNDRADVHAAYAALRRAIDALEAIEGNLQG